MLNGMKNKSFFCAAIVILVLYLPLDNNFETGGHRMARRFVSDCPREIINRQT